MIVKILIGCLLLALALPGLVITLKAFLDAGNEIYECNKLLREIDEEEARRKSDEIMDRMKEIAD